MLFHASLDRVQTKSSLQFSHGSILLQRYIRRAPLDVGQSIPHGTHGEEHLRNAMLRTSARNMITCVKTNSLCLSTCANDLAEHTNRISDLEPVADLRSQKCSRWGATREQSHRHRRSSSRAFLECSHAACDDTPECTAVYCEQYQGQQRDFETQILSST